MNAADLAVAVSAALDMMMTANAYYMQAQRISLMVQAAQAAGRDITPEEWATIHAQRDAARAALVQALGERP